MIKKMYRLKSDVEIHIPGLPPIVADNVNEYGAMIIKDYPQFADRIEEYEEKEEPTITEFAPPEDPLEQKHPVKKAKKSSPSKSKKYKK